MATRVAVYLGKVLAVFALLGPLVGLVIFALGFSVNAVTFGPLESFWLTPFFLIYGLPFAHFAGLMWAVLAGLVAGGTAMAMDGRPRWVGAVAGAVSVCLAFATGAFKLPVDLDLPPETRTVESGAAAFALLMAAVHIGSSFVCWLIARRFRLPRAEPSAPAKTA